MGQGCRFNEVPVRQPRPHPLQVNLNSREKGQSKEEVIRTSYINRDNTYTHPVVLIRPKLAALHRLFQWDWEYWFWCVCAHVCVSVSVYARLCLIGSNWAVKTLPPQSARVRSLHTNTLSCGFVLVSAGVNCSQGRVYKYTCMFGVRKCVEFCANGRTLCSQEVLKVWYFAQIWAGICNCSWLELHIWAG